MSPVNSPNTRRDSLRCRRSIRVSQSSSGANGGERKRKIMNWGPVEERISSPQIQTRLIKVDPGFVRGVGSRVLIIRSVRIRARPYLPAAGLNRRTKIMKLDQRINMSQTALVVTVFGACPAITRVAAGSQCFA